jgi:hypothetical protein
MLFAFADSTTHVAVATPPVTDSGEYAAPSSEVPIAGVPPDPLQSGAEYNCPCVAPPVGYTGAYTSTLEGMLVNTIRKRVAGVLPDAT